MLKSFNLILCLAVMILAPHVQAASYKTVEWKDLIPAGAPQQALNGTVTHDQISPDFQSPTLAPVVDSLDKQKIRLAGFAVPLEGDDNGITEFLLVPYMGACIHVPPPPSNQIIYVKGGEKLPVDMIYDAFWVTGTIKVGTVSSELAEAGYSLTADGFEVYEY